MKYIIKSTMPTAESYLALYPVTWEIYWTSDIIEAARFESFQKAKDLVKDEPWIAILTEDEAVVDSILGS